MAAKRINRVMVRLDDELKTEVASYGTWVAAQMPGVVLSEAEALRSLVERGLKQWRYESKAKKTRVG